jgi:hypothetical protein
MDMAMDLWFRKDDIGLRKEADAALRGNDKAASAVHHFVAGPATSALSALSFVAYRHGILTERHFHLIPEGSLFDKSCPAHCLFHPPSPPFRGFVYYGNRLL